MQPPAPTCTKTNRDRVVPYGEDDTLTLESSRRSGQSTDAGATWSLVEVLFHLRSYTVDPAALAWSSHDSPDRQTQRLFVAISTGVSIAREAAEPATRTRRAAQFLRPTRDTQNWTVGSQIAAIPETAAHFCRILGTYKTRTVVIRGAHRERSAVDFGFAMAVDPMM